MKQDSHDPSRRRFLKMATGALVASAVIPALTQRSQAAMTTPATQNKTLILYFTRTGTTREVAEHIHAMTGGDLFQIQTVTPYPANYRATTAQAKTEQENRYRPALAHWLESVTSYDRIFIGYPNWWGTLPMAVFAFLEHYNWQDKQLVPFCTHEGSAFGNSLDDLDSTCRGAHLLTGLALHGGGVDQVTTTNARRQIASWVSALPAHVAHRT